MQETRASDFLISFVSRSSSSIRATGASDRLTRLGLALVDLAESTTDDFFDVLRDVALSVRCEELMRLERLINEPGCPPSVARAADQYRNAFRDAVKGTAFFRPAEFRSDGPSALPNVQTSFRRFGTTMLEWPEIRNQAVQLVSELFVC